jgi:hypothetical protein
MGGARVGSGDPVDTDLRERTDLGGGFVAQGTPAKQPQTTNGRQLEIGFQFAPVHQRYSSCCILAFLHPLGFLPSLRPSTNLHDACLILFPFSHLSHRQSHIYIPFSYLFTTFDIHPLFSSFLQRSASVHLLHSPPCVLALFRLCALLSLAEFCKMISICAKTRPLLISSV